MSLTASGAGAAGLQLANDKLKVRISDTGKLLSVQNKLASETYACESDAFELDTDLGLLSNKVAGPAEVRKEGSRVVFHFDFDQPGKGKVGIDLIYTLGDTSSFFRRALKVTNSVPLRVKSLRMGRTAFTNPAEETIHYLTFWQAPTVEFIRYASGGLFTGIENPFYKADLDERGVALSFEPGLILKAGEGYESEPQFMGVYKKSGVMIEDSDRPFRYPNGSGYVPIDRNESRAMRAFALDYLAPVQKGFLSINYQFFHPLPMMPKNDADKLYFTKAIDTFADIRGDMIIFNTIKKYKLSNWNWDPSRGSAMNCHDETHGHIAGMGAYKGWLRCMELGSRLKADNPGLFIQAFYGTKQFGLWGLKDVDGHEVYNEQTACVSTHHTQISDDRQNADGLRFQNYWSMRFRFLPTVIGHPLVGRMSEGCWDRELVKACDFYGWQYSLMSALAVSGSIMPAILPYESDLLPGYKAFYKKWTRWAKENFEYVQYTEPFGEQVQPGAVDGYARIKGDHGFVFLFNGNPRSSRITFEIGDEINLQEKGDYEFVEIYPAEDAVIVLDDRGNSIFAQGQKATVAVPANDCKLLELRRAVKADGPVLVGTAGRVALVDHRLDISAVSGKPGRAYPLCVRLSDPEAVKEVKVNGVDQTFSRTDKEIALNVQFAGDEYVRDLDQWTKPDGRLFDFPYHVRQDALEIKTRFRVGKDVAGLLQRARPKNLAEMGPKIAAWQADGGDSYSYHNFTCCRPDRLWLIVPFTLQRVGDVKVVVNSKALGALLRHDRYGHSFYADITDLVNHGADNEITISMKNLEPSEFMGPFLMYPDEELTGEVLLRPHGVKERVVYTRSLIPRTAPRYIQGAKRPVITQASVTGNVTLGKAIQLQVKIDLPPDKVREVKYTESGFPWMGIHDLRYNADLRCWTGDVAPGNRAAIQESEYVHVWAVGNDGLYSDYYPVKVGWDFVK
ncbi:MAG: hypothetical protein NTW21_03110 [Verrucomicrobia bacterium]|nr:hypothetical protein [Verrucomicrobiota bacterium]